MQPADVADATESSLAIRAAVFFAWLAALAPAALALRRCGLAYFRWLPIPVAGFWLVWVGVLVVINAPFAVFWGLADGALAGLATAVGAVAFHAALLCRGPLRVAFGAAVLTAFAAFPDPSWQLAAIATPIAGAAVPIAWRRCLEGRAWTISPIPRGSPTRAIATLLGASLVDPLLAVRVAVAALVFGGVGALVIHGNGLRGEGALLVAVGAALIGSVGVMAHIGQCVARRWTELRWLLITHAATPRSQTSAMLIVAAIVGGIATALIAGAAIGLSRTTGGMAVAALAIAALAGATTSMSSAAAAVRAGNAITAHAWLASLVCAGAVVGLSIAIGPLAFVALPAFALLSVATTSDGARS